MPQAPPLRRDQTLVLVEAQGAVGEVELARQIADRERHLRSAALAGLAQIPTIARGLHAALADEDERDPALVRRAVPLEIGFDPAVAALFQGPAAAGDVSTNVAAIDAAAQRAAAQGAAILVTPEILGPVLAGQDRPLRIVEVLAECPAP